MPVESANNLALESAVLRGL